MSVLDTAQVMAHSSRLRLEGHFEQSLSVCNAALEQHHGSVPFMFSAACTFMDMGFSSYAAVLFERCVQKEPKNWRIVMNLASCYRRMHLVDESIKLAKKALRILKREIPDWKTREDLRQTIGLLYSNLSACYVNEGRAKEGEPYARKALEFDKDGHLPKWNLSLILLEQGKWDEGFQMYKCGKGTTKRKPRNYAELISNEPNQGGMTPQLERVEHLQEGQTVVVYGEQGIGDEIMFGTCLTEFFQDCEKRGVKVIFECQDKLEELFKSAFPDVEIYGTRNREIIEWPLDKKIDWAVAIGDLPSFYRKYDVDFQLAKEKGYASYIKVDKDASDHIRKIINKGNGKPVIGIAWTGGILKTAVTYRSLRLANLQPILELDANFVSLQYENPAKEIQAYKQEYGKFAADIQHYQLFTGMETESYMRMAELVAACDIIISVCQSVVHLCGAMGLSPIVLVPDKCAWRYCPPNRDKQIWYQDNLLIRQEKGEGWARPIRRAREIVIDRLYRGPF